MLKNQVLQPFVKWAGGKRQLLPEIMERIPKHFGTYHEPFVGGGAVLFTLQPERAVINDANSELMNCYKVIRDSPDELIAYLGQHKNEKDYFYIIRNMDLSTAYANLSPVERAARIIYLNHTCFNGLFRVNSHGHFNVPFGRYANPQIVNEPRKAQEKKGLQSHRKTGDTGIVLIIAAKTNRNCLVQFDDGTKDVCCWANLRKRR